MTTTCPKCYHTRLPDDFGPKEQCPKCQVIYRKYFNNSEARVDYSDGDTFSSPVREEKKNPVMQFLTIVTPLVLLIFGIYYLVSNPVDHVNTDEVILLVSDHCAPCIDAGKLLWHNEIDYTEINVDIADIETISPFITSPSDTVPILIINKRKINADDPDKLHRAVSIYLNKKGLSPVDPNLLVDSSGAINTM